MVRADGETEREAQRQILRLLAARIREARRRTGMTLEQAAGKAGLSRRFLVEIEAARTNPSIGKLASLAHALGVALRDLCDIPAATAPKLRIAMIGLRGAGKSTLGRMLAARLEVPFTELDDWIEERAGFSVSEIFELHGTEGYRRLERDALEDWLARHGSGVLAVPGGIVSSPATFERLCQTCRTVWLKARPQEHWDRVLAQGDLRPMKGDPRAMERLEALLAARTPAYRRAALHLDTSGRSPEESLGELVGLLSGGP